MRHITPPAESQWTIVARQFRRKRSAVWGLRVTLALLAVAIYAPAIASNQPFVWRAPGGSLSLPWFALFFVGFVIVGGASLLEALQVAGARHVATTTR